MTFQSFMRKHKEKVWALVFALVIFSVFNAGNDIEVTQETASIFGSFTFVGLSFGLILIIGGIILFFVPGMQIVGAGIVTAGTILVGGVKLFVVADIIRIITENPLILIGAIFLGLVLMLWLIKKK